MDRYLLQANIHADEQRRVTECIGHYAAVVVIFDVLAVKIMIQQKDQVMTAAP